MNRRGFMESMAALGAGAVAPAWASPDGAWPPAGTTSLVVPYKPGTALDLNARDLAHSVAERTGRMVIVENRSGASGSIGATAVVRGKADGSIMLLTDPVSLIANPLTGIPVSFDWKKDLRPISLVASVDLYLFSSAKRPFKTFAEMVRFAKANPGALNAGTTGLGGSVDRLCMERIKAHTGISVTEIPYTGLDQIVPALTMGDIDLFILGPQPFLGPIRQGAVRALVAATASRSRLLPDVPTLREEGLPDDLFVKSPFTVFAPAALPDGVAGKAAEVLGQVLSQPAYAARFAERGWSVATGFTQADAVKALEELEPAVHSLIGARG